MKTSENGAPIQSGGGLKTVRERITQEFERARTVERRRYSHPGEIEPELFGRRKDDPQVEVVMETSKNLVPLAKQAAPLLDHIKATGMPHLRLHEGVACWNIGAAPAVENVDELFGAALTALGYQSEMQSLNLLRTCIAGEPKKPSVWNRDILRRK
jgi:hypothetical protein